MAVRFNNNDRVVIHNESGISLMETAVALAVLGVVAVIFLTGLTMTTRAAATTEERATALGIARSQMEWAQSANYTAETTEYSPAALPDSQEYSDYAVSITALPLNTPDDGIQKITVTVTHTGEQVFALEDYKVNR